MDEKKPSIDRLEQEGWTRRFTASEPRLSESVELYREAGFEVWLEPIPGKEECDACDLQERKENCQVCFEGVEDQYRIIFTRPVRKEKADFKNDLKGGLLN